MCLSPVFFLKLKLNGAGSDLLGAGLEAAKADATNTSYDAAIARLQNAGLGVVINKTTAWAGKKVANGAAMVALFTYNPQRSHKSVTYEH